jgi:hypothetical protein
MPSNASPVKVPPSLKGSIQDDREPREKTRFDFSSPSKQAVKQDALTRERSDSDLAKKQFSFGNN